MERGDFERLLALPEKTILGNIVFAPSKSHGQSLIAQKIRVKNAQNLPLYLNATYRILVPSYSFNFSIRGVGPICRLDVNDSEHLGLGRTHKHSLSGPDDPRRNLPSAVSLPQLEEASIETAWRWLCNQAKIVHNGRLILPEKPVTYGGPPLCFPARMT